MLNNNKAVTIFLITSIAALGGLFFGYDTGVISGAIIFIKEQYKLSTPIVEIIVSVILLGAAFGAIISGRYADRFGRRKILLAAAFSFIVGTFISATAPTIITIIAGRFIIGLAIGIASYAAPFYISEISPKQKRGALVILNTISVTGGIVIAYLIDLAFHSTQEGWRWMFGLGIIPAILLGIGLLLLPPSPRWIARKGFIPLARAILHRIHSADDAEKEFKEITYNIQHEKKGRWRELFSKKVRILLILGIGLAIIQQITGINTILYYAPTIFQFTGMHSTESQLLATLGMGIMNFVMTIVAMFLVDKFGRRKLLLTRLAMMTLSMSVVSFAFYHGVTNLILQWISIISLLVFVAFYVLSIGCLFWLIISEIYPLNLRGKAMSLAAMGNWFANLIVALSFLSLINAAGPAITFLCYTIAGVLSWIFSYWLVPETKQISLEEIEKNLFKGKRCREIGQPLRTAQNDV